MREWLIFSNKIFFFKNINIKNFQFIYLSVKYSLFEIGYLFHMGSYFIVYFISNNKVYI